MEKKKIGIAAVLILLFVSIQLGFIDFPEREINPINLDNVENIQKIELEPQKNSAYQENIILVGWVRSRGENYLRGRVGIWRLYEIEEIEDNFDTKLFRILVENEWHFSDEFDKAIRKLESLE